MQINHLYAHEFIFMYHDDENITDDGDDDGDGDVTAIIALHDISLMYYC